MVHFGEGIDIGSLARRLTLAFWRGERHCHFGEEIDIGILARRLTLAFWSKTGGWGLSSLNVVKRDNMNYDPT
jgi:aryl carrier-like protein